MFGLLRPRHDLLGPADRARHMSAYCNLCGSLSLLYGLKARMLVVHDIATLAWLIENPEAPVRSFSTYNCVKGGVRFRRDDVLPLDKRFLAAISAYAIGVKVRDDALDAGSWKTKTASAVYQGTFDRARNDLRDYGFDVDALEAHLAAQCNLEQPGETDLELASGPTGAAYSQVAGHIHSVTGCRLGSSIVAALGEALGRAIYVIDAIRDYKHDFGLAYNPLCLASGEANPQHLPPSQARRAAEYLLEQLQRGSELAQQLGSRFEACWRAVERQLRRYAGIGERSVVLNMCCGTPRVIVEHRDGDAEDWGRCLACICFLCMTGACREFRCCCGQ